MRLGLLRNKNQGLWVQIDALKAEYGPLSFLGAESDYTVGDRVAVGEVGPDEYIVLGVLRP